MLLVNRILRRIKLYIENGKYKNISAGVKIPENIVVSVKDNLIIKEGGELESGAYILNTNAKFIIGRFSGVGPNLTVITGNHLSVIGKYLVQVTEDDKKRLDPEKMQDKDVVIEDDAWIGANVTLLSGVRIGRGAIVSAGSVVRQKVPPYAMVAGNPAKIVGFRFSPKQVEEHEKLLYVEEERLPLNILEKNYQKYYLNRLQEINSICRL